MLYWIMALATLGSFLFINPWSYLDFYIIELVNLRCSSLSWFMVLVILFVSPCVNLNSIDYLSIMDSSLFLSYMSPFPFSMITFVLTNDLLVSFLNWDLLGMISYLLINYWSSKVNSGIKAVVYNKVGDIFSVLLLSWSSSFLSYHPFLYVTPISFFINYSNSLFYSGLYSLPLLMMIFSKSAQLPFYSWSLNAMSAPTPIPASLHSSTMVMAGVYLGMMIDDTMILLIDISFFASLSLLLATLLTLMLSLFKAISVTDIKSIIAFSTISQISYMFLALLLNPLLCLFHIIIHALFKSLLFLLAGSLIHVQSNHQSIYSMKINHSFIKIMFLLAGTILILSLSKEGIIHCSNYCLSSYFVFCLSFLGGWVEL